MRCRGGEWGLALGEEGREEERRGIGRIGGICACVWWFEMSDFFFVFFFGSWLGLHGPTYLPTD